MELVDTGIVGLNEMLGGGIPKGHTVVVLGGYGTGKPLWHSILQIGAWNLVKRFYICHWKKGRKAY